MIAPCRAQIRALAVLGLGSLLALSGGCQLTDPRPAAAQYYDHDGMWCGRYDIGFEEARVAARMTLAELKMPIYGEGPDRHGVFIDTRTPDNHEARIVIIPPGRQLEGTRICVRVGGFGTHRQVCEHLLGDIAGHLDAVRNRYRVAPGAVPPAGSQAVVPASTPSLPPEPVPVSRN
jgi:hypothetical protein